MGVAHMGVREPDNPGQHPTGRVRSQADHEVSHEVLLDSQHVERLQTVELLKQLVHEPGRGHHILDA